MINIALLKNLAKLHNNHTLKETEYAVNHDSEEFYNMLYFLFWCFRKIEKGKKKKITDLSLGVWTKLDGAHLTFNSVRITKKKKKGCV